MLGCNGGPAPGGHLSGEDLSSVVSGFECVWCIHWCMADVACSACLCTVCYVTDRDSADEGASRVNRPCDLVATVWCVEASECVHGACRELAVFVVSWVTSVIDCHYGVSSECDVPYAYLSDHACGVVWVVTVSGAVAYEDLLAWLSEWCGMIRRACIDVVMTDVEYAASRRGGHSVGSSLVADCLTSLTVIHATVIVLSGEWSVGEAPIGICVVAHDICPVPDHHCLPLDMCSPRGGWTLTSDCLFWEAV